MAIGAAGPVETIHIRVHPVGDVCLGNCANYEVTVQSNGALTSNRFFYDGKLWGRWRAHISRATYAAFKQRLSVTRPEGEVIDRAACERWGKADSPDWKPDVDEIDITWQADGKRSRLVTCNLPGEAATAYVAALRLIGVNNGSGERWEPEPEDARDVAGDDAHP